MAIENMTPEESTAQAMAMLRSLQEMLNNANAQLINAIGEIAALNLRVAKLTSPVPLPSEPKE